jgi:tellurite resistance protein
MENEARINLLARVAQSASSNAAPPDSANPVSILSLAAASYGSRPSGDATVPTGFDPLAIALFEAIVEGAYLVANADGVFDAEERRTFEHIVVAACGRAVAAEQIAALISDLGDQLKEDGGERRIQKIAEIVTKKEHARELLRIASLIACVSDEVSSVERAVLAKLAGQCGLEPGDVDAALADARRALT